MTTPKHLKKLVSGRPVATVGKWKIYKPSAKLSREIDQRIKEMKSGKVKSIPLDDFLRRIKRSKKVKVVFKKSGRKKHAKRR